jgi:hypothetical protein
MKIPRIPTAYYLKNDGYLDVPDPKEWELFQDPWLATGAPCIHIQMQNYLDYDKSITENDPNNEPNEDEDDGATESSMATKSSLVIWTGPTLGQPMSHPSLQLLSSNVWLPKQRSLSNSSISNFEPASHDRLLMSNDYQFRI